MIIPQKEVNSFKTVQYLMLAKKYLCTDKARVNLQQIIKILTLIDNESIKQRLYFNMITNRIQLIKSNNTLELHNRPFLIDKSVDVVIDRIKSNIDNMTAMIFNAYLDHDDQKFVSLYDTVLLPQDLSILNDDKTMYYIDLVKNKTQKIINIYHFGTQVQKNMLLKYALENECNQYEGIYNFLIILRRYHLLPDLKSNQHNIQMWTNIPNRAIEKNQNITIYVSPEKIKRYLKNNYKNINLKLNIYNLSDLFKIESLHDIKNICKIIDEQPILVTHRKYSDIEIDDQKYINDIITNLQNRIKEQLKQQFTGSQVKKESIGYQLILLRAILKQFNKHHFQLMHIGYSNQNALFYQSKS